MVKITLIIRAVIQILIIGKFITYHKSSTNFDHHQKGGDCWQKEEDGHLPSIRSFDDDDEL